ncbi:Domain of unknown function (DUF1653)-containing protein [uncultured virus]|nr:Domain of unknown function (DUF1653)-containing protein [uncultured virus]
MTERPTPKLETLPCGVYVHYSGKRYEVTGTNINSETLETLVNYTALYGERLPWSRPLKMFLEQGDFPNGFKQRFVLEKETAAESKLDPLMERMKVQWEAYFATAALVQRELETSVRSTVVLAMQERALAAQDRALAAQGQAEAVLKRALEAGARAEAAQTTGAT